jgi:DNA repair exonuclease SbcCD nuclease subunit
MPVALAPGNHDWLGPSSPYALVNWESHVHLFQDPKLSPFVLEDGFTIWGAAHTRPAGTPGFFDSGFSVPGDGVHIALFHGAEKGFFQFEDDHKEPHAGFRESQIPEAGLDYAFVGHYHHPRDSTHLTYPGNPDPLSFGEEHRRGAVVAEVKSDGTVAITRHDVAVSEVHDVALDISACTSAKEVRQAAAAAVDGLSGCVRLTLHGDLAPEIDLRLDDLDGLSDDADQIVTRFGEITVAYDFGALADDPTVRGQFVRTVMGDLTLDDDERRRVLITGLRALDSRSDLGVE